MLAPGQLLLNIICSQLGHKIVAAAGACVLSFSFSQHTFTYNNSKSLALQPINMINWQQQQQKLATIPKTQNQNPMPNVAPKNRQHTHTRTISACRVDSTAFVVARCKGKVVWGQGGQHAPLYLRLRTLPWALTGLSDALLIQILIERARVQIDGDSWSAAGGQTRRRVGRRGGGGLEVEAAQFKKRFH